MLKSKFPAGIFTAPYEYSQFGQRNEVPFAKSCPGEIVAAAHLVRTGSITIMGAETDCK